MISSSSSLIRITHVMAQVITATGYAGNRLGVVAQQSTGSTNKHVCLEKTYEMCICMNAIPIRHIHTTIIYTTCWLEPRFEIPMCMSCVCTNLASPGSCSCLCPVSQQSPQHYAKQPAERQV